MKQLAKIERKYLFLWSGLILSTVPALGWFVLTDLMEFQLKGGLVYLYLILVAGLCFSIFGYVAGSHQDVLFRYLEKDNLTVLLNQTTFFRQAHYLYQLGIRYKDPLAIVMLDLDFFKNVNDENNHLVGSAVLKEVALIIQDRLRETDIAARFGGDEFVICLPRTDLEQAAIVAERVRQIIEQTDFKYRDCKVHVTASFGVSSKLCEATKTVEDLTEVADKMLYEAKKLGRNCVVLDQSNRFPESTPSAGA